MKLTKVLLVEGQRASYNYPELSLNIMVLDSNSSLMTVTKNKDVRPLSTHEIALHLGVTEADVCQFLQCKPGSVNIETVGDTDGNLAKIRWGCLTGFAGAKSA